MIPDFKYLVERLKALTPPRHIIDRCNLTILLEPGYEDYADFLARHRIEIIASMPCYSPENVNAQRGERCFRRQHQGITDLKLVRLWPRTAPSSSSRLQPERRLSPGPAGELEADYKRELKSILESSSTSSSRSRISPLRGLPPT